MQSTNDKPLTFDELLARCMGELEFARKLLRDFLRDSDPTLDEIEASINDGDHESAAKAAHRLKGTAALLAAKPLCESLRNIEKQLRGSESPGTEDAKELLNEARNQYELVKGYVNNQLL